MKDFQITLDLVQSQKNPSIQVKESDLNSIRFVFTIKDNGEVVDLTDTTVRLAIRKPSLLTVFQDCTIIDTLNGICEVVLTNQAYLEVGNHSGELILTKGAVIAVTNTFEFTSLDAILDDDTLVSANDWQAIHDLMLTYDKKPILGSGSPNTVVMAEYVGQRYLDTTSMTMFFASTIANDTWLAIGGGGTGGEGGPVYWIDVLEKPLSFTPSAHGHVWADITDAPTTMTPTAHQHDYTTGITNKPLSFAPSAHEHPIAEITGLTDALAAKLEAIPEEYLTQTEGDLRYAPIGAGGGIEAPQTGTADPTGAPDYIGQTYVNTTTGEAFVATTDIGGWQSISMDELGGGGGTVTWDTVTEKPLTFTPSDHDHVWADITDAPTTMTPTAHQHVWADITDAPTTMTPTAHSHAISEITDLTTTLEAKQPKPTTGTAAPVTVPTHIGQMHIDTTLKRTHIAEGPLATDWRRLAGTNYVDAGDTVITGTVLAGLSLWKGTQAQYDALTPVATTLYFITGA